MDSETLIYLHIPKTGGRSLQNILLRKYSTKEVLLDVHKHLKELSEWSKEYKSKVKYVQGHVAYGIHEEFSQNCKYITTLRDPVDRVISHYYFLRRSTTHALYKDIQNMSLDDYLTNGISDEVTNDQARMVAGLPQDSDSTKDKMLQMAKENIDADFVLAGLVEYFDETLILLKRRLGLRNIFYGIRNKTIGRPLKEQVPEETLIKIRELNSVDIELYDYVKMKLFSAIDNDGCSLSADIKRFKFLNRPYSAAFQLVRTAKNRLFI